LREHFVKTTLATTSERPRQ